MTRAQSMRVTALYLAAKAALEKLDFEPLNLCTRARSALDATRQDLERFDYCRLQQKIVDGCE